MDSSAQQLPIVDLGPAIEGTDPHAKAEAARKFSQACRMHGCVGLTGHGISRASIERAFNMMKCLFDLPTTEKMKAARPEDGGSPARGYTPPGLEKVYPKEVADANDTKFIKEQRKVADLKETFDMGSREHVTDYNNWLPEESLPGFRSFMDDFFKQLLQASCTIMELLLIGHGVSEEDRKTVEALTSSGYSSVLRLTHYPAIDTASLLDEKVGRMAAHTDWILFTLLFQDSTGGLEFQNQETGNFMSAEPREGMIYLNVGDLLMRLSNGVYPTAPHRVTVPSYVKQPTQTIPAQIPERYSMPFFFWPHEDMVVTPLNSYVSKESPVKYEAVKVTDYFKPLAKHFFEVKA